MTSAESRWSEVKAAVTEALDLPATDRHAYLDTRFPDPARVLVHLNSAYRFGRFCEAGSPGWVSVGVSVTGWGPGPDAAP